MEEKKNNKVLIIGLIFILVLCLVYTFFFMYKMISVSPSEEKEPEIVENNQDAETVAFTKLTKYELEEGEEKEVTVDGKKIILKRENDKLYLNGKEIVDSLINYLYVTNKLIIFVYPGGQFGGQHYEFYDFNANKIELGKDKEIIFENLRIENGKLLADGKTVNYLFDFISLGNISTTPCDTVNSKKLSEYPEVINQYKKEIVKAVYSFEYLDNKINVNVLTILESLNSIEEQADSICVLENNN